VNSSSRPLASPSTMGRRMTALGLMVLMLGACATSPQGKSGIVMPAPISDVYSDADMQLYLATIAAVARPCVEEECELNRAFDAQVQHLGVRIAAAAFDARPDLIKRISRFEFEVAEKEEVGTISNASGNIVILRGTQQIGLNEGALAFAMAREMGHVISQHHDENATARILFSVAVGVLFPAFNLFGNTAAFAQATSASTISTAAVATTAASTATSYLGARLILDKLKPNQLSEADQVALDLLGRLGWGHQDIAQALEDSAAFESSNAWSEDFQLSAAQVRSLESASDVGEPLDSIEETSFEDELPEMQENPEEIAEVAADIPEDTSLTLVQAKPVPAAVADMKEISRKSKAVNLPKKKRVGKGGKLKKPPLRSKKSAMAKQQASRKSGRTITPSRIVPAPTPSPD
jgi:phage gp16-like protein